MSTTSTTSRRDGGRVPVTIRPGVIVYAPPDDTAWRMDSVGGGFGEYRTDRDLGHCGILAARCDADASPRTKRAVGWINAHAQVRIEAESDMLRRRLAANDRLLAGGPAAARADAAPSRPAKSAAAPRSSFITPNAFLAPVPALARSSAADQTSPASPRRSAPVPSGAPRFEPDARLDAADDLTLAEKLAVRHRAASSRGDSAIPDAIAQLRAEKATRARRAEEPPRLTGHDRIDAEQAGGASGAAAKARRAMIERNLKASRRTS